MDLHVLISTLFRSCLQDMASGEGQVEAMEKVRVRPSAETKGWEATRQLLFQAVRQLQ